MRQHCIAFTFVGLTLFSCTMPESKTDVVPPVAEIIPHELTTHGLSRVDNYYWMNERENPNVIAYLEAENDYLKASLEHTEALQNDLFEEMKGRIVDDDASVPYLSNGYYYYMRYESGMEHPIYCRKKTLDSPEEVILNVNTLAADHDYYVVTTMEVSPDNKWLAFAADTTGRYISNMYLKNLETSDILPYSVDNIVGMAWGSDNKTIFYGTKDELTLRADRIYRHSVSDENSRNEVFYEADPAFSVDVSRSKSGSYIQIMSFSTMSSEVQLLDATNPTGSFKVFQPREDNHLYWVSHARDQFYILTNWDATNFRVMTTSTGSTNKSSWQELIAHRSDVLVENLNVFTNYLVVQERSNGLNRLNVMDLRNNDSHYIQFDEATYSASLSRNPEINSDVVRYTYESLTTPLSTFDYNMDQRVSNLMKEQVVLGGFDKNNYVSERSWAIAADGAKIPVSIVYRADLDRSKPNPVYQTGYGSYGYSYAATFSSSRLSLLDRGFIFAIAHIRGGEDMGRQWYEDGKLLKKKNSFTDFIAVSEHLIQEGYTTSDALFAEGASAGGLLMGAVANMRPDLYKGMIVGVPFVDVMTTMLDESIPLTTLEYDEWGNPNDKTYFDYMMSYSPYDNLEAKEYPAMLVTTAFMDSQVQYWEPAKYVAKLRVTKTDTNPLYLFTELAGSHGGKSGRFEALRHTALEYAFIFDQVGITK